MIKIEADSPNELAELAAYFADLIAPMPVTSAGQVSEQVKDAIDGFMKKLIS